MSVPTGSPETPDWPEERGPHLPDAITRIPLGVWPFLALALLAAYGRWELLRTAQPGSPVDVLSLFAGTVTPIAAPLLGAALFARHPDAHRTLPAVAFACVLFAASTVVDRLQQPILEGILGGDPFVDANSELPVIGYAIVQALVVVFAATYLAVGLADAMRFEDRRRSRAPLAILVLTVITVFFGTAAVSSLPTGSTPLLIVSLVAQLVTNLAWAYVGWTALRGWTAGEEPNLGWALAAGVGIGHVLWAVLVMLLNVVLWAVRPEESQLPFVFEAYNVLSLLAVALSLALLVAFWLGLPDVPDADEAEPGDAPESV
jgi:hypothetical protein